MSRNKMRSLGLAVCGVAVWLLLAASGSPSQTATASQSFDLLVTGGRLLDGTGNPWFQADIGVRAGKIVAVGRLSDATAEERIDATGKYVTPGFIDLHSHADGMRGNGLRSEDARRRSAPNLVAQGVTTVVVNQDGRSPFSIAAQIEELQAKKFGPNAILMVGHNTVRARAMARNPEEAFSAGEIQNMMRLATPREIETMRSLVREGMEEGAFGISAGLEYVPGRWSDTEEVVALAEVLVPYDGVFIEHERSSGAEPMWFLPSQDEPGQPTYLDSVSETIEVSERAGITAVATHAKARGANFWGSSRAAIQLIEAARERGVEIFADHYAYNTTGTDGSTRLIPNWVVDAPSGFGADRDVDYAAAVRAVLDDEENAEKLRGDIQHEITRRGGAGNIVLMEYPDKDLVGKTLAEVAARFDLSPIEAAVKLQLEGFKDRRGGARLRGYSLSEIDVEIYAAQEWMATASDAGIALPGDGFVHARYYGNFARKIRRYAMERGILSLEDAIRSSTSLPAQILGLRNRGLLREGFYADLIVMDPLRVRDKATFFEPHQYAEGFDYVFVNGEAVVKDGELTEALPGVVITPRQGRAPPALP